MYCGLFGRRHYCASDTSHRRCVTDEALSTRFDFRWARAHNHSVKEHIANRVQKLRTEAGYTQEEFAERLHVSRQTIIAIEKGNYAPSVLLALKIAACFKTSVEELFYITHEK